MDTRPVVEPQRLEQDSGQVSPEGPWIEASLGTADNGPPARREPIVRQVLSHAGRALAGWLQVFGQQMSESWARHRLTGRLGPGLGPDGWAESLPDSISSWPQPDETSEGCGGSAGWAGAAAALPFTLRLPAAVPSNQALRERVRAALEEWQLAQAHFEEVADPILVDHAAYWIKEAERKYVLLLHQARVQERPRRGDRKL